MSPKIWKQSKTFLKTLDKGGYHGEFPHFQKWQKKPRTQNFLKTRKYFVEIHVGWKFA